MILIIQVVHVCCRIKNKHFKFFLDSITIVNIDIHTYAHRYIHINIPKEKEEANGNSLLHTAV